MESLGKTIVSIYRKEWAEIEEQPPPISNGAIRNERSKVNKQIKDKKLDWKYVNGLIEFSLATYDQATIIKRLGEMRKKYRDCKKELIELQESINKQAQQQFDEKIQKDYDELFKEKVEQEKLELQERVEVQSQMIKKFMEKQEIQYNQIEQLKHRPSQESYDDLQAEFKEYVNATKSLKKSESTTSLNSVEDDSKLKKKYKKLKRDYEKLQIEHLKLKQKLSDSDSDSDTSSDEEIITEEL
jgi:DNA repair exonuclease SbcCD ATPase subunit